MSHFANDVHHRTSSRIAEVIPDFVESDHPQFAAFMQSYYKFLEQHDDLPIAPTFEQQPGVVTVQTGNSVITGANTAFANTFVEAQKIKVGSETFQVRSVANNTSLMVYEVPIRRYTANLYFAETNKTVRQASGSIRKILTYHDVEHTLEDFIPYFRDTYLRDLPHGLSDTSVLVPQVLQFYQSRGSEEAFKYLFRALYGYEIEISYPRDQIFTTSEGRFEISRTLKLADHKPASLNDPGITFANNELAPPQSLELRQIVGLTSNARATVARVQEGFDGPAPVAVLHISDIVSTRVVGNLLLDSDNPGDDGDVLLSTAFGTPPAGLPNIVYEFNLTQELASSGQFIAGETVTTEPINDPLAISGVVVGTVVGFIVNTRGAGYSIGDLIFPDAGWDNGYGAVGRVASHANSDIGSINIINGGEGYYAGITLSVENSGTGGSGLAGYVHNVSPGNITLHSDPANANGVSDGDVLAFVFETDMNTYESSREKVDYYEVGISISEVSDGRILLNSDNIFDDGDLLYLDDTDVLAAQISLVIGISDWGLGNVASALYGANLQSTILSVSSNLAVLPIYINGVRTEIGEIFHINTTSFGSGYVFGLPIITAPREYLPTMANGAVLSNTTVPFESATLQANLVIGQIGTIDVISGGSGYSDTIPFPVNADNTTGNGTGAVVQLVLGTLSEPEGRFIGSKSLASSINKLQDITRYQPFSYELTVENDKSVYDSVVRRHVHPAGGLLLVRETITSVLNVQASVYSSKFGRKSMDELSGEVVNINLIMSDLGTEVSDPAIVLSPSSIAMSVPSDVIGQGSAPADLIYGYSDQTVNGSAYIYFTAYDANTLYAAYQGQAPHPEANSPGIG